MPRKSDDGKLVLEDVTHRSCGNGSKGPRVCDWARLSAVSGQG